MNNSNNNGNFVQPKLFDFSGNNKFENMKITNKKQINKSGNHQVINPSN